MKKIILSIDGMTCSACSNGLEKYLNKQNGIINSSVNLVMANATVDYDENILDQEKIEKYVKEELNTFSFNKDTDAYKYLKETICVAIRNNNMKVGLETDIYKKIAIIHKKSPIQIKWAIEKLMNSMYMNTRCEIIKSYFEFVEDKKPTTKVFIQHIVDNYKK